jgi:hypothetical protein
MHNDILFTFKFWKPFKLESLCLLNESVKDWAINVYWYFFNNLIVGVWSGRAKGGISQNLDMKQCVGKRFEGCILENLYINYLFIYSFLTSSSSYMIPSSTCYNDHIKDHCSRIKWWWHWRNTNCQPSQYWLQKMQFHANVIFLEELGSIFVGNKKPKLE